MIGGIAGDIVGSRFEGSRWQGDTFETARCMDIDPTQGSASALGQLATTFELFHPDCFETDDTLMTIAVMDWLVVRGDLRTFLRSHFRRSSRPELFGKYFRHWALHDGDDGCGSIGNGAAMRVAPVAAVADDLRATREIARQSAVVTHEVEHAIAGAEAIASAAFLARTGETKDGIRRYITTEFGYDLDVDLNRLRPTFRFSSDCRVTVPVAIAAFLQSENLESTIRLAISVGGDTDTIACMAGSIAGYFWPIETSIRQRTVEQLDPHSATILRSFEVKYFRV